MLTINNNSVLKTMSSTHHVMQIDPVNVFPCCSHASGDHPNSFFYNHFKMSFFNCILWFGFSSGKVAGSFLLFLCVAIINVKRFTVSECWLGDPLLSVGISSSVMTNSM